MLEVAHTLTSSSLAEPRGAFRGSSLLHQEGLLHRPTAFPRRGRWSSSLALNPDDAVAHRPYQGD
jgi:hypothetical protein